MTDESNPELRDALREAGAGERASSAAARSTAGALDMTRALAWGKVMLGAMCALVVLNLVMVIQLLSLTAEVAENKANITILSKDIDELENGRREISRLPRAGFSKSAADNSDSASEIPAAPRSD